MDELPQLLDSLLSEVATKATRRLRSKQLTAFLGTSGAEYRQDLLVVGRAVNGWAEGWYPKDLTSADKRQATIETVLRKRDEGRMQWVLRSWQRRKWHCRSCNREFRGRTKRCPYCTGVDIKQLYNTAGSAFWRVVRHVVDELGFAADARDLWANRVAWTNLYKISPSKGSRSKGGNPSASLRSLQFPICSEILRKELGQWKPRRIVFLTDIGWARRFLEPLDIQGKLHAGRIQYVGASATDTDTKVVVGPHPQSQKAKPERSYAKELALALGDG